jgi:phage tail-like protein
MAGETQDAGVWPLPKFYFSVDIGDQRNLSFQEVSGLDSEAQVIEYRGGDNKQFSTVKMPGVQKVGNVTLKKGVFAKDSTFFDWYSQIRINSIKRVTMVIRLLDENGNCTMEWTLLNAWPTKITGTDLKSDGNEVAVEAIEIAYESVTVKAG